MSKYISRRSFLKATAAVAAASAVTVCGGISASAASKWSETSTKYGFNVVKNEGGKTLSYDPSRMNLIEVDGLAFKDMAGTGKLLPYEDWRLSVEERVTDLANRLSIEEIAGLMLFSTHQRDVSGNLNEDQKIFLDGHVRAVLSAASAKPDADQIAWSNAMQRYCEGNGYSIPCYISTDPRNGAGTSDWPGNLGLAATFDPNVALEAGKCISKELRDLGIANFLAPQVDIAGDPRWARCDGTFGEDPALSRDVVRAFCDGLQSTYVNGEDIGWGADSIATMAKHWTGEGAGEYGREGHTEGGKYAVYPGKNFEALMIPFVDGAFKLDGKTKCAVSIMSSYTAAWSDNGELGEVVGSSFSDYKINQVLRKRYGFEGAVCTDWAVLNEGYINTGWGARIEDPTVTPAERALWSIEAGCDQMGGCGSSATLVEAYELGCKKLGKDKMDKLFARSAKRLLEGYFLTGLFENPYLDEEACLKDVNSEEKQKAALEAQCKAIIMVKNHNNVIKASKRWPWEKPTVYIPAIYTPASWSWTFVGGKYTDVAASAVVPVDLKMASKYFNVVTDTIAEGPATEKSITRASAAQIAKCDFVLCKAYEPTNCDPRNGKDHDGNFIPLSRQYKTYIADGPCVRKVSIAGDTLADGSKQNRGYFGKKAELANENQLDQILDAAAKAKAAGIPCILAMSTGRPLCFHEFEAQVDAILVSLSGSDEAICKIAAGKVEPSGLLPMQMPKDMNAVEAQLEDLPRDMECYVDTDGNVYDFAFGMNYAGVINDARVAKYRVAPLTTPTNKGV